MEEQKKRASQPRRYHLVAMKLDRDKWKAYAELTRNRGMSASASIREHIEAAISENEAIKWSAASAEPGVAPDPADDKIAAAFAMLVDIVGKINKERDEKIRRDEEISALVETHFSTINHLASAGVGFEIMAIALSAGGRLIAGEEIDLHYQEIKRMKTIESDFADILAATA